MPRYPATRKTITYKTDSDTGVSYYEASHGDNEGSFSSMLDQCYACGLTYPMEEISYWRSRPYCPDCRSDISRLIERERGTRIPASPEAPSSDWSDLVP